MSSTNNQTSIQLILGTAQASGPTPAQQDAENIAQEMQNLLDFMKTLQAGSPPPKLDDATVASFVALAGDVEGQIQAMQTDPSLTAAQKQAVEGLMRYFHDLSMVEVNGTSLNDVMTGKGNPVQFLESVLDTGSEGDNTWLTNTLTPAIEQTIAALNSYQG